MTNRELKKLNRADLLELLLRERRENEQLRSELDKANQKLSDRAILLENAGSISEAALRLNGVFEAAEAAATQYLENIQRISGEEETICQRMEEEARKKAEAIRADADAYSLQTRSQADQYHKQVAEKVQALLREQDSLHVLLCSYEEGQTI